MTTEERPLEIKSQEINTTKFTFDNLAYFRGLFPNLSDETLARFLIARNNDREKAYEQLVATEKWRTTHFPILKEDCINELRRNVVYSHGYDKEGHPIFVMATRNNNKNERDLEELGKAALWWFEKTLSKLPEDKSKITILFDRADAGQDSVDMEFSKKMVKVLQDKYPERMHRAIVYPTGFVYYAIWNVFRWFLDPVTANKVQPMMYFSGVQQFIEDKYIPKAMGGESEYVPNYDELSDPFAAEIVQAELDKRIANSASTKNTHTISIFDE